MVIKGKAKEVLLYMFPCCDNNVLYDETNLNKI